jgi:signal transduction histidine kinase
VARNKIRQVFNNLIGNAIKFTPSGGSIVITADVSASRSMAEVSVRDTGIGIPPEVQQKIFDKFMQIRPNREDVGNVKGTGLGLTIVKGIVEAHGGAIRVDSEQGNGSAFIFTLPLHKKGNYELRITNDEGTARGTAITNYQLRITNVGKKIWQL